MVGLVYTREVAVRRRLFFFAVTFPGRGGFKSRSAFERECHARFRSGQFLPVCHRQVFYADFVLLAPSYWTRFGILI
jgi:hypothetical protein